MLNAYRKGKEKADKVLSLLLTEEKSIKQMLFNMQYTLVTTEMRRENRLRMKLVREREINCASGDADSCDLYFFGFHNDEELEFEGIPTKYNVVKTKNVYQHTGMYAIYNMKIQLLLVYDILCYTQIGSYRS